MPGKGCVLVAASGNDDFKRPFIPPIYPKCRGRHDGRRYAAMHGGRLGRRWSNYGSYLGCVAPGNDIVSTTTMNDPMTFDGLYSVNDGTSAAAPFVSGVAALILSIHPNWTNAEVVNQIETTCTDLGDPGWDQYYGWGLVNAYHALANAPLQDISISQLTGATVNGMVKVANAVVTSGSSDISDRMYAEQSDRAAGIMIASNVAGISEGDVIAIMGTLSIANGEWQIQNPSVTKTATQTPVKALGMAQKAIGGAANGIKPGITGARGPNNMDLLVTVYGKVTATSRRGYFYIDDGSALDDGSGLIGLKVICNNLTQPAKGSFVRVTGISSCEIPQGLTYSVIVLRARRQSDITKLH